MRVTSFKSGIVLVEEDTQYKIASMFMRLQEFYESPIEGIKDSYFTVEQYMDAYAELNGNFTYTKDWVGFNIPGHKVVDFFNVFSPNLTMKEAKLYSRLRLSIENLQRYGTLFYVLGVYRQKDIEHESAHALWYLDPLYRKDMKENISKISYANYSLLSESLIKMGYDHEMVEDEIQAYLATSDTKLLLKHFDSFALSLQEPFMETYSRYKT